MEIVGGSVEDSIFSCTEISIKLHDNPRNVIENMQSCLIRGNLLRVSQISFLTILNATEMYHFELKHYAEVKTKVDAHELNNRREFRAIQREILSLIVRLKYLSGRFEARIFGFISEDRRLDLVREKILMIKARLKDCISVSPVLSLHEGTLINMTFLNYQLKEADNGVNRARVHFNEELGAFRNLIRAQYL